MEGCASSPLPQLPPLVVCPIVMHNWTGQTNCNGVGRVVLASSLLRADGKGEETAYLREVLVGSHQERELHVLPFRKTYSGSFSHYKHIFPDSSTLPTIDLHGNLGPRTHISPLSAHNTTGLGLFEPSEQSLWKAQTLLASLAMLSPLLLLFVSGIA